MIDAFFFFLSKCCKLYFYLLKTVVRVINRLTDNSVCFFLTIHNDALRGAVSSSEGFCVKQKKSYLDLSRSQRPLSFVGKLVHILLRKI